jgi:Fungal chitosanase of glycosyl hydrolase group 75
MTTLTLPQPRTLRSPRGTQLSYMEPESNGIRLLKRISHSNIKTHVDDDSTFFYEAGLDIDADGSPHAYHPDGRSGLDYLSNAGRPGNWWALVTHNGKPTGKPVIQKRNDPAPGFYVSTTTLQTPSFGRRDPRRYVNSEAVNFIVLPRGLNLSAKLGDYAVVIRPKTGAIGYAVYADVGPARQIGEGSIALANALGIPSNAKTGGVANGIVYIVFHGSSKALSPFQPDIDKAGAALFANWGGLGRAQDSFPEIDWA